MSFSQRVSTAAFRVRLVLFRRQVVNRIEADPVGQWPLARRIFASSPNVYMGAVGACARITIQTEIFHVLRQCQHGESLFWQHLDDDNPAVAGYCVSGLEYARSPLLSKLPATIFERLEMVRYSAGGCFVMEIPVGTLAKMIVERYEEMQRGGSEEDL